MRFAGLISDHSIHYLDHLAPFCALHESPLIILESQVAELAAIYYPGLTILKEFDPSISALVCCEPKAWVESILGPLPKTKFFWLPHGHSDKGLTSQSFRALRSEQTALIYGERMQTILKEQNPAIDSITVGNFRLAYYQKQAKFYQMLLAKELPFLNENPLYFFAPTWDDAENNSSLWKAFSPLLKALPSSCNLLVKIHPNSYAQHPHKIERLIGKTLPLPNVHFCIDFPPIHPLLSISSAYIGDASSIGYDAACWNLPLFLFSSPNDQSHLLPHYSHKICFEQIHQIFSEPLRPLKNLTPLVSHVYCDFQYWS